MYNVCTCLECRSRIHERTISLRFLGIILRVLRLEVSAFNVYITNSLNKTTFAQSGGGGLIYRLAEVTVNSKEETLKTFVPIMSKNSAPENFFFCIAVSRTVFLGKGLLLLTACLFSRCPQIM